MSKSIFNGSLALIITLGLSVFTALEIDGFLGISVNDKTALLRDLTKNVSRKKTLWVRNVKKVLSLAGKAFCWQR